MRMWREGDFAAYAEMCADPEVMRYIGGGPWRRGPRREGAGN